MAGRMSGQEGLSIQIAGRFFGRICFMDVGVERLDHIVQGTEFPVSNSISASIGSCRALPSI